MRLHIQPALLASLFVSFLFSVNYPPEQLKLTGFGVVQKIIGPFARDRGFGRVSPFSQQNRHPSEVG